MSIVRHAEIPPASLPGIDHLTLAAGHLDLKRLSVWKQRIAPRQATPPHRHDCEEVIVVLAGSGELHVDGRTERFDADTTLVLLPNVTHQISNTGDTPLDIVAVLSATPVAVEWPDGRPLPLPWQS